MAENLPNLKMETNIRVQDSQRAPNQMNRKRPIPRHIIIKMPKVKDKERILKAAREKQSVNYKGNSIRLSADSLHKQRLQAQQGAARYIQSPEREKPETQDTPPSKIIIQNRRREKEFLRQAKIKRIQQQNTYPKRNIARSSLNRKEESIGKRKPQLKSK